MKNVPHLPPLAIIAIALLVPACRSTRNITSTQSSTTAITQKEMDIATRNAVTTRKRKLTITYIPMLPILFRQSLYGPHSVLVKTQPTRHSSVAWLASLPAQPPARPSPASF
ncbi:MAG: hypothetical protein MJY68_10350 [Bacteroidaceae bacterium]|nr:hypothetical protein [Bacteroidaceae bacterium]